MKPILTAFFKEKILTVQYQDLSFTDYYLDGTTWRKMPSMKTVMEDQLTQITEAMEIVSKKRIANAKRRETRLKNRELIKPVIIDTNSIEGYFKTKENSVSRGIGGWVRSFFTKQ